jgi:hypothetical protein
VYFSGWISIDILQPVTQLQSRFPAGLIRPLPVPKLHSKTSGEDATKLHSKTSGEDATKLHSKTSGEDATKLHSKTSGEDAPIPLPPGLRKGDRIVVTEVLNESDKLLDRVPLNYTHFESGRLKMVCQLLGAGVGEPVVSLPFMVDGTRGGGEE